MTNQTPLSLVVVSAGTGGPPSTDCWPTAPPTGSRPSRTRGGVR
jgi:hypothetical protein